MENGAAEREETNRDRVRRLLFDRLGFRLKRGEDAEAHRQALDRLADDLAYLGDGELEALRCMVEIHGEGKARNQWPGLGVFRAMAQIVRPRPVDELPALRRWFASVEGPRALRAGTLVETADFFERRRRPPTRPGEAHLISDQARKNERRLQVLDERVALGRSVDAGDVAWARRYRARLADLKAIVETGEVAQ
ncbi:hypothetical protein [Marinibacterium profundimaris]|uniref:hypothetical protein n=1 Tax=Marinibacterium profundimaris TaxID=1679460 RepID=UPI000B524471|nr:hypothetical protein [Marinibacterium profundimaris]